MNVFLISAAAMVALALALLLPALLRASRGNPAASAPVPSVARQANLSVLREQLAQLDAEAAAGKLTLDQLAQAKSEIERRALDEDAPHQGLSAASTQRRSVGTAAGLAVVIPVLAIGLYLLLGNPLAVEQTGFASAPAEDVSMAQIEAMVAKAAQRLENQPADQPADPQAWEMLARSYAALQRFPEADKAYKRAVQLAPQNAQLLADHADVLAMLQGQSAAGEPTRLIERALKLDPKNLKALSLAGSAAFERKDFAAAVDYWSQARLMAQPGSEFAAGLDRSIDDAKVGAGAKPGSAGPGLGAAPAAQIVAQAAAPDSTSTSSSAGATAAQTTAQSTGKARIQGTVSLAPELAAKLSPDDTVFIFARAASGPRMPLAIVRRKASDLPITFTLDDSSAMSPDMSLSKFPQVVVGARVSKSGNAMPQSGDLVGQSGAQPSIASGLAITINSVQP